MSRGGVDSKVYVGDLARDATEKDLDRAFSYYGPLRNVWVARNPPGFAFIEYEDPRDADDAVRGVDGTVICGSRVRVEHSTGKVRPKPWIRSRGPPRLRRPYDPSDRCYECGDRGHYAYDCTRSKGSRSGRNKSRSHSRSRSRSRSGGRRRSYSRSRSRERRPRSYSRSHSRERRRSVSKERRSRSRSKSQHHRSPARDSSPARNGDGD